MTELSYFWDGVTLGDAIEAPYDDDAFFDTLTNIMGSFVIPYTHDGLSARVGSELLASLSSVVGTVAISPGAAFVKGILYTSDEFETVAIASNAAGNPRIDRIVLQRNTVNQTVRLAVKQGTAAATPTLPTISNTDEFSLAWVWVANGYNSAVDTIADDEIHDERIFQETGSSADISSRHNLLQNAEFLGITSSAAANAVAKWTLNGPATLGVGSSATYRGRIMQVSSGTNNEGIETTVPINQNDCLLFTLFADYLKITAGEATVKVYGVNTSTAASTLLVTKRFRPTTDTLDLYIRIKLSSATSYDALRVVFNTESAAASDVIFFGEISLTYGYLPIVVYNHEIIWLEEGMADAAWTASAKSTGTTTINLVSSFGSVFLPYVRGVILKVRCRDSASAAAVLGDDTSISLYHVNHVPPDLTRAVALVSCAGRANDTWEEQVVYVPLDHTDSNAAFKVYVTASGAGTLDATIEVLGIIT